MEREEKKDENLEQREKNTGVAGVCITDCAVGGTGNGSDWNKENIDDYKY